MTFQEILDILADKTRTDYQRAADLHAALTASSTPSALKVKPMTERKRRGPNKAKDKLETLLSNGAAEHGG